MQFYVESGMDLPHQMDKMLSLSSGGVAQLGERYVRNVQARGSNPLISTIIVA
jgi:hypothetical protein